MKKMKNKLKVVLIILLIIVVCFITIGVLWYFGIIKEKTYTLSYFNMEPVLSDTDYNQNGIDDYTDILNGAKIDAKNKPKYVADSYTVGGYPSDDIGVCTDVIWRALKNAGYNLKDMIDKDISENISFYPATNGKQDKNIDFRRVRNLKVFFDRYAKVLTNDLSKKEEFQAGDIVIFGENYNHIGIISNLRNKNNVPYLIHNSGQPKREENILEIADKLSKITGHYRFEYNEKIKELIEKINKDLD